MKYTPLHDRIIVQELDEQRCSAGGIWIPDAYVSQKRLAFGRVIGIGKGRQTTDGKTVALQVKVGDVIAYPRQAPIEIPVFDDEWNEHTVLVMREADVVAIVKDMPKKTSVVDARGAPLSMLPRSHAKSDSTYVNQEAIEIAEREGWTDSGDHRDEES